MAPDRPKRELVDHVPSHADKYRYARLQLGPHDNFVYVLMCPDTRKAAVIDPAFEPERILALLDQWQAELTHALFTHRHPDHVNGAPAMQDATGCDLLIHEADADVLTEQALRVTTLRGGESLDVGQLSLRAHHTPGHTAGGLTYQCGKRLFTGDFLFVDTCGRTDFPTGSKETIWNSLQWFKQTFPDDHIICPGHDYGRKPEATVGEQTTENPALGHGSYAEFEKEWFLVAY